MLQLNVYGKSYEISENWSLKHDILIVALDKNIEADVISAVTRINLKKLRLIEESKQKIKDATQLSPEEHDQLVAEHLALEKLKYNSPNNWAQLLPIKHPTEYAFFYSFVMHGQLGS